VDRAGIGHPNLMNKPEVTRKDGKPFDTIPTYVWTRFIGGAFDKQQIVGRDLEKKVVRFGEEAECIYSKRVHVFGGFRLIAHVSVDHPRSQFWPYEAMREMAATHPHLMKAKFEDAKGLSRDGKPS
jgi:hypothetical protein